VRVLIVDDHASICKMLAYVLRLEDGVEVVGETGSGQEALKMAVDLKPDVMILDLLLRDLNGTGVLRKVRSLAPGTRVLFYSGCLNVTAIIECLQARPDGYVDKTEDIAVFREGLRAVASGKRFFSTLPATLLDKIDAKNIGLTQREAEVMQLIAEGKYSREIADLLKISPKTVEIHRANLMAKVNARNTADITRHAMRNGVVE